EVDRGGEEERPPKRRSFCPLGENKQRGRERDEVQAVLCGFGSRQNRDKKSEVVKVKWEGKWQKEMLDLSCETMQRCSKDVVRYK
ncbi:MAG: hypothetical protein RR716_03670, partial [Christensenellaceae bacterium]